MSNVIPLRPARCRPEPGPALQHYQDQARLAWFGQLVALIEDGVQVFGQLSAADAELSWLGRAKGMLAEVEELR